MPSKPTYEELEQKVKELEKKAYEQKLYEVELRKTLEIYQQLAENIREVLIINSPDKNKTIYVNPAYEEMWGMPCSSLYENPKSFLDAIHPQDRKRVIETFNQQKDGKSIEVEYRLVRADEPVVWVNSRTWTAYHVLDHFQLSFVALRDITKRKQLEEKLKRANEELEQQVENGVAEIKQYKHIIETMDNPIGMVDRNFIYRYANEPYRQALNKPIREIIEHSVSELFGQKFFETVMENHYKRCFSGETVDYQAWFDLPGWGPRYFDVHYYPFRDSDGHVTATIVNVHDITKIKKALQFEHKLSKLSSEFINLTSENIDSKILDALAWIGQLMQADRSYLFRFNWEKTKFRLAHMWEAEGIPKDETVRGLIVKEAFPWLSANLLKGEKIIIPDVEMLATEKTINEYQYCRAIGIQAFIILPIEMENSPLCAIGLDYIIQPRKWSPVDTDRLQIIGEIVTNAIARNHAEKESEIAAQRYRTVADYTYDWEYWEDHTGMMEYVSPSCERICGYSVQEFKATPSLLKDIILPEDQETWHSHRHSSSNDNQQQAIQFRIKRKDGQIRWIEHVCQHVKSAKNVHLGTRASNRDITDRKRAELEAQKHREQLTHISRVTTLGEFSASLAHELNQPLTAIRNNANAAVRFISQENPNLDEVDEILNDIIEDDKRAAGIIKKLRTLMSKKDLVFSSLNINSVINGVVKLANREAYTRDITLILELEDDLPQVRGDAIHLEQVILNLILNGVEAMASCDHSYRKLIIRTAKRDDHTAEVSATDMGPGIDQKHLEQIFEAFYTTKSTGMGIGLSICRSIIEVHGGRLWAKNHPDRGATVSFTVPLSTGDDV